MKLKLLSEPASFKLNGKNYINSNTFTQANTFAYCIDLISGNIISISREAEIDVGDYEIVRANNQPR